MEGSVDVLVLIALLAAAVAVQVRVDVARIEAAARSRTWIPTRILWVPWARFFTSTRGPRHYAVRYRDPSGRDERRLCRVSGLLDGACVFLEPAPLTTGPRPVRGPLPRAASIALGVGAGAFVGTALGILAAFALVPGSNIAPAYGVLLGGPLGALVGGVLGALRR